MDYILSATSRILLLETQYLAAAVQELDFTCTTDITALDRYLWIMMIRIRNCNCRLFGIPEWGGLEW